MTNDARSISMTFATLFAMKVKGHEFSAYPVRANFHLASPGMPEAQPDMAHLPNPSEPSKRLLLTRHAGSSEMPADSILARMKRDRRFPHRVELILYNTNRIPSGYMREVLQRVFHESAGMASLLVCQSHIRRGPYTMDVARMKAGAVRHDAQTHDNPVPVMRYVPVGN